MKTHLNPAKPYTLTNAGQAATHSRTRKQLKHDMLLNFMAQSQKLQHQPAPRKPSLLRTFMSLFL